ncbi:hypothetical protein ACIPL1_12550 [Pseudomonas sp. NPDC090202]|uniref:hypothetical protein n=1 Tax=unclassified Pseudomonas TaxID=196821 RepID=UPI00381DC4BA
MAKYTIKTIARVGTIPPSSVKKIDVSVSGITELTPDVTRGDGFVRLYEVGNDADAADCIAEGPVTKLGNWTLLVPLMSKARYDIYVSDYDNNEAAQSVPKTLDWVALIK